MTLKTIGPLPELSTVHSASLHLSLVLFLPPSLSGTGVLQDASSLCLRAVCRDEDGSGLRALKKISQHRVKEVHVFSHPYYRKPPAMCSQLKEKCSTRFFLNVLFPKVCTLLSEILNNHNLQIKKRLLF